MTWPRAFLLAAAASACAPPAPPPADPSQPVAVPPASPPASAARPTASAAPPSSQPPDTQEIDCSDEAFVPRRDAFEAAEKRGDAAALKKAIDDALVVRPRAHGLWTALARVHLNEGAIADAGVDGRILVEINDGTSPFGWYLQGLAAEAQKRPAEARAFFARSALQEPTGDGARKLGSASRCTAIAYAPDRDDRVEIVKGWRGVFANVDPARMVRDERPEPTTDADARERVCVHSDQSAVTERGVCKGAGPWIIRTGHQHFHDFETLVLPLPAGRFGLISYFTGMPCRGGASVTARVAGPVIEVKNAHTSGRLVDTSVCDLEPHDALSNPCIAATDRATTYYDAQSGRALLTLDERNESEKHELKGTRVKRTGVAGCDETIDLQKPPPDLPSRPTR